MSPWHITCTKIMEKKRLKNTNLKQLYIKKQNKKTPQG